MSSLRRAIILGAGATLSLLALGFVLFASVVTRLPAENNPHADGIVVLTGEGRRIAEGARLLDEGRAQRMLISGVFRRTGKKALLEISGLPEDKFDCCVDVGLCRPRYRRQCQRNARLGRFARVREPHRRHRQLSHAAQPRRAVAGHASDAS